MVRLRRRHAGHPRDEAAEQRAVFVEYRVVAVLERRGRLRQRDLLAEDTTAGVRRKVASKRSVTGASNRGYGPLHPGR